MKFKSFIAGLFVAASVFALPVVSSAQEGEPVVIDEVIAQVNDGVVTLSQLKREMKERIATMKEKGVPEAQATAEVEKKKPELIATLINEQLLLQKGKELDLSERVEAQVNRRMLEVAQENKITSIEKLCEAMAQQGLNCEDVRRTMRTEMMKQAVIESEVDSKMFYGWTPEELRGYFEKNKSKFIKPEAVELSEIFLNLAGKPEADVKARANQLVAQVRGGADFGTLAAAYSERSQASKGKVGSFETTSLRPDIAAGIKNVQVGGVSEPLKTDEGYQILRVDARTSGQATPTFNETKVREELTRENLPQAREKFLQDLRNDGYVNIAAAYRDSVAPLLNIVPPAAATKTSKDKKDKP